jgi:pyrroline-5-carboxylate reductase
MIENQQFAIIGFGVMGEAILSGLIEKGGIKPDHIIASEPREERRNTLIEQYGIRATRDNADAASQADVVILAVKPQKSSTVLKGLADKIKPDAVVISIIAGVPLEKLTGTLKHSAVIRVMPNTPARIGEGISVWVNSPGATPAHLDIARETLKCLGSEVYVEEESYMDMATALSGTGPAYVFLFMEALIDAGVHMGFPRWIAEELVVSTLRGSVLYYQANHEHPAAMRNQVVSPGGTTAEALYYLEKAGFRTAISRAVWAAYQRSKELGAEMNREQPHD